MLLTASNDGRSWQPRPRAPLDARRVRQRLGGFVAVSILVHALTFGAYAPGAGGQERFVEPAGKPVLHAALVREPLPEQPRREADEAIGDKTQQPAEPDLAKPAAQSASADATAHGTVQWPMPERWYEAAELDRRAEPLSPVEPVYPPELAGLSAAPAKVRLRLYIDERGAVRKLEIAMAGPRPEFDDAAMHAWESVRFSPAVKGGVTVKSQKLLELAFAP